VSAHDAIPTLESERLIFRGHTIDDFADSAALWGDPVVTRYIGGMPLGEEDVWARLLRNVGHWSVLGFGYWVVREKASGRFVGEVGFADFKRALVPSIRGMPEMGWVLASWAHGRGFATEAVRAALAWGATHFSSPRIVCIIHPDNAASLRVAQKCDFVEVARATYKERSTILFGRDRVG
jgi:RimJ/RimL family protein N-acetyltransferase